MNSGLQLSELRFLYRINYVRPMVLLYGVVDFLDRVISVDRS